MVIARQHQGLAEGKRPLLYSERSRHWSVFFVQHILLCGCRYREGEALGVRLRFYQATETWAESGEGDEGTCKVLIMMDLVI